VSKPSVSVSTPDLAIERAWEPRRQRWLTRRDVAFLTLTLAATAWAWRPLTMVISRSLGSDEQYQHYSHIVLIPVIVLYLLFQNRVVITRVSAAAPAAGSIVFAFGAAIVWIATASRMVTHVDYRLSAATFGLVVAWLGAFTLAYGVRAVRASLYPLTFLGFMVPMPPAAIHSVIVFLQHASAEVSGILFGLIGMPVFRQGDLVFALPGLTIQVAEECSGIRSSLALLIIGFLISYIALRTSWARAVFVAAVIPVAIFKNAVRIVVLSWLAIHVDPAFISGGLTHRTSGIPVFLLALSILGGMVWLLRRLEARAT
jgi:exosortase